MTTDSPDVFELEALAKRLGRLEDEARTFVRKAGISEEVRRLVDAAVPGGGPLPIVPAMENIRGKSSATAVMSRGGDGGFSFEPGERTLLVKACGAGSFTAYGVAQPLAISIVSNVYWSGDCLYKEYWNATIVSGRVLEMEGPCVACVVCATDCIELEDPYCEGA